MSIQSISEIIRGRPLYIADAGMSVSDACRLLDEHRIGALVVMDGARLKGIFSERDVVRRVVARGRDAGATTVGDVMTADPVTISAREPLAQAMRLMLDGGFRHLPVLRADEVVGIISMRDIPTEYRLMAERFRDPAGQAASA